MTEDPGAHGVGKLLDLLNAADKKTAEKLCRDLLVNRKDLVQLILAGRTGALEPYQYACHFTEVRPEHLELTAANAVALDENGVGPLSSDAAKAVRKISQTFVERRVFAAHLFYLPSGDIWHLFYFDQRDLDENENHWTVGGPHIHYSRECFTQQTLKEVWESVCALSPKAPKSLHVRFERSPVDSHG